MRYEILYERRELNKIIKKKELVKTVTRTFDKDGNKNHKQKQLIVLMKSLMHNN